MLVILSYTTTRFDLLKKHWTDRENNKKSPNKQEKLWAGFGIVVILSWKTKEILKIINQENPMGILQHNGKLYINDARNNEIKVYNQALKLEKSIKNKHFNDLHSIQLSHDNNFIITSAGLDLLLKIDSNGKSLYEWWAGDNGYDKSQTGEHIEYDKSFDYSKESIPTPQQATHLNYAIETENGDYLISLFHQGELIKVNPKDKSCKTLVTNLNKPHSIRFLDKKYYLADSKNGKILVFDKKFNKKDEIMFQNAWIQDFREVDQEGNQILVADADNCKIYLVNTKTKEIVDTFSYSADWRISAVLPIA